MTARREMVKAAGLAVRIGLVALAAAVLSGMRQSTELTFGRPARSYQVDGYTIMVWNTNVLAKLDGSA